MKVIEKKSIDAMQDLQILSKEKSRMICGGNDLPEGWTKTELPNGDTRYDGPNGSYLIVHSIC